MKGSVSGYSTISLDPESPGMEQYPETFGLQVRNHNWRQAYENWLRPELKDALKGICSLIYEKEGVVRSMENLGARELPYFMVSSDKKKHYKGHYFIIKFDSSALKMFQLQRFYRREDDNIIRVGIVLNEDEPRRPCLDGPCRFGEFFPEHDKMAYRRGIYKKMNYPRAEAVKKRYGFQ